MPDTLSNPETTRGLTKRWKPHAHDLPSGDLVDRVLASRGLTGPDAAAFLEPTLKGLHDPSLIPDLDRAAERILAAIKSAEPIVIYGDYDADGITATCILFHTIRTIAPDAPLSTYVPHRLDEGYGINSAAIEQLAKDGAHVIVSVDCGITAIEPALTAKKLGVDLIITDHHNPPASDDDLPDAFAIVHPRRPGSAYPYGELCGAGVAYKLAWRLATMHAGSDRVGDKLRALLLSLLGPAALGTIADVVPLQDENRVITRFGLTMIQNTPIVGLRALVEASDLHTSKVDTEAVGFMLAPRLNACGRLGHAADAVELLTTAEGPRAKEIAERLCRMNDDRRATERKILDQALEMAEAAGMTSGDRRAIVLSHPDWHPGVVGIVCSRLTERFGRPAILMQRQGDTVAGSGRSIDCFNLHAALGECSSLLTKWGGHDMAAGLKLDAANLDAFVDAFTAHANDTLSPDDLIPSLGYDCDATLAELSTQTVARLEQLAPFGRGNSRVRLRVNNLRVQGTPQPFGKTGAHLGIRLEDRSGGGAIKVVAWKWADRRAQITPGAAVDAIIIPKVSSYSGRVEPELCDLRIVETV